MKTFIKVFNISLLLSIFIFSGCDITDKINENILDIKEDSTATQKNNSIAKNSSQEENTSNKPIIEINSTVDNSNSCSDGTHYDSSLDKCVADTNSSDNSNSNNPNMCGDGTIFQNGKCVIDNGTNQVTDCKTGFTLVNGQCVSDNQQIVQVDDFNLTFPDYNNAKSIDIVIGKNSEQIIAIRSNPQQTDTSNRLENFQLSSNNVVDSLLLFDGAPIVSKNYDFSFKISSKELIGKDEFQLTLKNSNGFTDSVFVNVEVVNQISLSGVRQTYSVVTEGDPIEVVLTATNVFNTPLKFEIVDKDIINAERKIILTPIGSSLFSSNTKDGVDFKFSVKGLEDYKQEVEVKVIDVVTGTTKSVYLVIESVRRNTQFYTDLYECGELYNKSYEITQDINTPENLDGVYSADNAIFLKSVITMDYDISNQFSKVIVFHPTNGDQYTYPTYGKEYITNLDTGKKIAVVYFAKHLQGLKYFVKYYNEDRNTVVCEKRYFGYIDAVNEQPDVLENLNIPDLADKPNGPDGL